MNVLFVNQYFWPDMAATAQLLADLGEDLAAQGCRVRAIAGRGRYAGADVARPARRETWRGVAIRRVACTDFGRGSVLGRATDYAAFLASAALAIVLGRRPDVVVCLSTPALVGPGLLWEGFDREG